MEHLVRWVEQNGMECSAVTVASDSRTGRRGLFAARAIDADEDVLSVPQSLIITRDAGACAGIETAIRVQSDSRTLTTSRSPRLLN